MATSYDLWDIESGNLIDTFTSEAAALTLMRGLVASYGRDYANGLDLGRIGPNGRSRSIATGPALLERAHATMATVPSADRGRGVA